MSAATVSEHDRYVATVARLRGLCAGLPASVHAALNGGAATANGSYPHRTVWGA